MTPHGIGPYTRGCRCEACTRAWREYSREWDYERRHVGPRTVPVEPVRRHLEVLYAAGHTSGSISAATGVKVKTIHSIRSIPRRRVRRTIADALLGMAVDDSPQGPRHKVPAGQVTPLVRAMLRVMTHDDLRTALGGGVNTSHLLRQEHVTQLTARRVRLLYLLLQRRGLVPGETEEVRPVHGAAAAR